MRKRVSRVIIAVLVCLSALAGGHIGIARASTSTSMAIDSPAYMNGEMMSSYYFSWADTRQMAVEHATLSLTVGGGDGGPATIEVDGTSYQSGGVITVEPGPPYHFVPCGCRILGIPTSFVGDGKYHVVSWTGFSFDGGNGFVYDVAAGSFSTKFSVSSGWESSETFGMLMPLACAVDGPSVVPVSGSSTFSAVVTGGVAPYQYGWQLYSNGVDGSTHVPYPSGVAGTPDSSLGTSSTCTVSGLAKGYYSLQLYVTDSTGPGSVATSQMDFIVSSTPGGYTITLERDWSDDIGEFLCAKAAYTAGDATAITSASGSSAYIYQTENAQGNWYHLIDKVSSSDQDGSALLGPPWTWRWPLWIHVQVGSNTMNTICPGDFWFKGAVTISGPNNSSVICNVVHHFVGGEMYETWTGYFDAAGNQINAETPPVPVDNLPPWLRALRDILAAMFSPIVFLGELVKFIVNCVASVIGYIQVVLALLVSLLKVIFVWLAVALGKLLNFATATPGTYMKLADVDVVASSIGTSSGADTMWGSLSVPLASVDSVLAQIRDTYVVGARWQWVWWTMFVVGLMGRVIHGKDKGGDDDAS